MRSITWATLASIAFTGVANAQFERFSRGVSATINEVRIGQPGADVDQYVEFSGAPGASLNGLQLVVIGDAEGQFPPAQNGEVEILVELSLECCVVFEARIQLLQISQRRHQRLRDKLATKTAKPAILIRHRRK